MNLNLFLNITSVILAAIGVYILAWCGIASLVATFVSGLIVGLSGRFAVSIEREREGA
jgi:uncharacterized membrane protein HdeD (DUF308 family)